MAYEQRDNSGSLFKNEGERKRERGPDYSGNAMIEGAEYFFDCWVKTADSGRKWLSCSFKRKEKQQAKPAKPKDEAWQAMKKDDDFDSLPF